MNLEFQIMEIKHQIYRKFILGTKMLFTIRLGSMGYEYY